jgi:hypothetical protein
MQGLPGYNFGLVSGHLCIVMEQRFCKTVVRAKDVKVVWNFRLTWNYYSTGDDNYLETV